MGFFKRMLPASLYYFAFNFYEDYMGLPQKTYSQEGEDLILRKIFPLQQKGFYVDVGAYHPKTFSNTYYFYKKGWQGINIDANPMSIQKFKKFRKRDININIGISETEATLDYYMFADPALNTFSEKVCQERKNQQTSKFLGEQKIATIGLEKLLDKHISSKNKAIDFMNIDVEGLEMQVLATNDWDKYRPKIVLVEEYERNLATLEDSAVYRFFRERDYHFVAKTYSTFVFIDSRQIIQ